MRPLPTALRMDARAEIYRLRAAGHGYLVIARTLNESGVPTPSGHGRWHPTSVMYHVDPARRNAYMRRYRDSARHSVQP